MTSKSDEPKVALDYQSPAVRRDASQQKTRRWLVGIGIGLRVLFWLIRIAVLVAVVIYARRMVRIYGQFMPK